MSEKNLEQIPTLEDVVEVGAGIDIEQENIHIVADNAIDDPYDDEFDQLLKSDANDPLEQQELIADTESVATAAEPEHSEPHIDFDNELALDAPESSRDNPGEHPSPADIIDNFSLTENTDDADIGTDHEENSTATASPDNEAIALDTTSAADDVEWSEDWQEDLVQSAVVDDDTASAGEESKSMMEHIVAHERHDTPPPASSTQHTDSSQAPQSPHIDSAALTDQLVSELMPEIEWKLRNKIREVLEQQFANKD